MKQYITIKQLNELSKKGKEGLWHWYVSHDYDELKETDDWNIEFKKMKLTIGRMIEILSEHHKMGYDKVIFHLQDIKDKKYDLCDELWESCKVLFQ